MTTRSAQSSLPIEALKAIQAAHLGYRYRGVPLLKSPFDLALYAMLLWENKPRTIIELGAYAGGSALWLADQVRAFGLDTHILSCDIESTPAISDPRITFRKADALRLSDSLSSETIAGLPRPLLVIEDADHRRATTLAVLRHFSPLMRQGEYMVVEDGIVTSLGLADDLDGGPATAIQEFLDEEGQAWTIDTRYCDYYGYNVTWNANGYLKKVA
jgi:cephalosporin hydroxylase